jgi:putative FmdB family regulatory protein
MPIYDFKCHNCNNTQEVYCSVAERNDYQFVCKECGCTGGERQISPPVQVYNTPEQNMFKGGLITSMDLKNGRPINRKKNQ